MTYPNYTQRIWMTVYKTDPMTQSTLWIRQIQSPFPISVGERIAILVSEDEPEGSVHQAVRSTHRDIDGTLNAELLGIIVDPDDRGEAAIRHGSPRYTSWWLERDGYLPERLHEAGWLTYEQWRAIRGE